MTPALLKPITVGTNNVAQKLIDTSNTNNVKFTIMTQSTKSFNSILLILSLIICLISCESDNSDTIGEADMIKNHLISTWQISNFKSISFFEDNTFIDSTFATFNDNPGVYQIHDIIRGTYSVENNQLKLDDIVLVYCKAQTNETTIRFISTVDPVLNIHLDEDVLELETNTILSTVDNSNSGINRVWTTDILIAVYDKNLESQFTGGVGILNYDFNTELNELIYEYEYIYDDVTDYSESTVSFKYSNSVLEIDTWYFNTEVTISQNQMIWNHSKRTFTRQ